MNDKIEENNEKLNKIQTMEKTQFWGNLSDVGLVLYQVEWQRIGNMQSSAGVLMTAITIIYSAIFLFFSISGSVTNNKIIADIVIPAFCINAIFISITTYYLFKVIWPKKVKGIPSPITIEKQFEQGQLGQKIYELVKMMDIPINELHQHIQEKQRYFSKGILSAISSFIMTGTMIAQLTIQITYPDYILKLYYGSLIIFILTFIYLIFFYQQKFKEEVVCGNKNGTNT